MEKLLKSALSRMKSKGLIDEDDEDIYRFGLECLLLKAVHYASYIIISVALGMTIPMLVSAVVMMPLRRKSGGFHARTRVGCYLFSCVVVVAVCLMDKITIMTWIGVLALLVSNVIVIAFAPVENENRTLSPMECKTFRRQSLIITAFADAAIIITYLFGWKLCRWLLNGMTVAALLAFAGVLQGKYRCRKSKHKF